MASACLAVGEGWVSAVIGLWSGGLLPVEMALRGGNARVAVASCGRRCRGDCFRYGVSEIGDVSRCCCATASMLSHSAVDFSATTLSSARNSERDRQSWQDTKVFSCPSADLWYAKMESSGVVGASER